MKQVININFQGRVVPIEVTAFDILKNYTESLNRHFANEVGKEEIINDIESRIGELFQEKLKNGATCITDDDVNAIIKSMGRPEEFEEDTATANTANAKHEQEQTSSSSQSTHTNQAGTGKRLYRDENNKILGGVCSGIANYFHIDAWVVRILFIVSGIGLLAYIILWAFLPSEATTVLGSTRKRLYRDGDDKLIAGVCSGIGNYFGISAWIPRVLFLLPFLSFVFSRRWSGDFPEFFQLGFSPGAIIIYIILWLVIPEAFTTTEKLEMKGEKVDLNSIKNSVMEEMKGVQQRAEKFGKEAKNFVEEKGKTMSSDINSTVKRSRNSLGDIIALLVKIFVYFIVGCVCIGLIIGLFAIGVFSVGIFPLKDFILVGEAQHLYAWGTLIFFIGVPIVSIITFIVRRIAKLKRGSKMIRLSTICLWILGWFCFIMLLTSVRKEFRYNSRINVEDIALTNNKVNKLVLANDVAGTTHYRYNFFRMQAFEGLEDDTAYIKNVDIRIVKSPNDSFRVTMLRLSNGRSESEANRLTSLINFNVYQKDSLLMMDKGFSINTTDKFRNQRIILTVYVPLNKQIRINRSVGWGHNVRFDGPFWDGDIDLEFNDHEERGWDVETDYIMKADGLYTLDGKPADEWKYENRRRKTRTRTTIDGVVVEDSYRYEDAKEEFKQDSIQRKKELEQLRKSDSIQKEIEKLEKEKQKVENDGVKAGNNDELQLWSINKFPAYSDMMNVN